MTDFWAVALVAVLFGTGLVMLVHVLARVL